MWVNTNKWGVCGMRQLVIDNKNKKLNIKDLRKKI